MKKLIRWFKNSAFSKWIGKVFKYQLGKLASIIYKDAIGAVEKTMSICELIENSNENYTALINIIEAQWGIKLNYDQIGKIENGNSRIRFYIAKELLEIELKSSKKEYKEYVIDTVIQLAYSYLKERGE